MAAEVVTIAIHERVKSRHDVVVYFHFANPRLLRDQCLILLLRCIKRVCGLFFQDLDNFENGIELDRTRFGESLAGWSGEELQTTG